MLPSYNFQNITYNFQNINFILYLLSDSASFSTFDNDLKALKKSAIIMHIVVGHLTFFLKTINN